MKNKKEKKRKNKTLRISVLNMIYTSDPEKGKNLDIQVSPLQVAIAFASVVFSLIYVLKKLIKTIKGLF